VQEQKALLLLVGATMQQKKDLVSQYAAHVSVGKQPACCEKTQQLHSQLACSLAILLVVPSLA